MKRPSSNPRPRWLALLASLAIGGCGRPAAPPATAAWRDPSPHAVRTLAINGVRLQVLDWGGKGDGLVFIHGLGDSPHAFDDLAPSFTDRFRVVAYARRSHGRSELVPSPLDHATLTEDLRQLLDGLGIRRAVLAGWSMAGNEITEFASLYPERTAGVVYLESGYDWSDTAAVRLLGNMPQQWIAMDADRADFAAYRAWWADAFWPGGTLTPAAEAEVRDIGHVGTAGRVTVPTDLVLDSLFASVVGYTRDYRRVKAPALAIYSDHFLPPEQPNDSLRTVVTSWNGEFAEFRRRSMARLTSESGGRVETHILAGVQHMAFPWQAEDTLRALLREFLTRL